VTERLGVIPIDKPAGPTSFDVVRAVRRAYGVRKAGHTGTLDPFATGVLLVCVGRATRLVPWLQAGEKEYLATVCFGVETDTLDPTGEVAREASADGLTRAALEAALPRFVGRIRQTPPAHSAVKVEGRRAYELARAGKAPDLAAREVVVHALTIEHWTAPSAGLRVRCGPGFYVRALARDLGGALGVPAHLTALRRTETGGRSEADCVSLEALEAFEAGPPPLLAPGEALDFLPALTLDEAGAAGVANGRLPEELEPPAGLELGAACRLLAPGGGLLAVAERGGEGLRLARVFGAAARQP